MKKTIKRTVISLSVILSILFGIIIYADNSIANEYKITKSCNINLNSKLPLSSKPVSNNEVLTLFNRTENNNYSANILFMNFIPIKTVDIEVLKERKVIPCGTPFGVKVFTKGVLVVGISDVKTENNIETPAKNKGIKKGDIILTVNQVPVNGNDELIKLVENSNGETLSLEILRETMRFNVDIKPVKSTVDNLYKLGIWVRDSSAGIGTLTFMCPENYGFAGLGHGICDVDTEELLPISYGDVVKASINGIVKGSKGVPGELQGYFIESDPIGNLEKNTLSGVYGKLNKQEYNVEPIVVAMKQQVQKGKAQILTTISGITPQYYDIEIQSIDYNDSLQCKNMVIKITDENLLSQTGGIIQGMSGSPIIQNGLLIGAVTHVFVNDPQKGYAIFAENMLNFLDTSTNIQNKKAS